jgi:hypothetical protein
MYCRWAEIGPACVSAYPVSSSCFHSSNVRNPHHPLRRATRTLIGSITSCNSAKRSYQLSLMQFKVNIMQTR